MSHNALVDSPDSPLALLLAAGTCLAPAAIGQEEERRQGAVQERRRQEGENSEIATVRRRLKVMRYAVGAFKESGNREAAALIERAMHTRELAIKGIRNEKAAKVRESAPNRGVLAEHLGAASNLYEKWGKVERSRALADLTEVYAQQWRRQQRAKREGRITGREREHEGRDQGRGGSRLDSLEYRVKILAAAQKAYDKAGRERERGAANRREGIRELQQRVERLQKELQKIQEILRRLGDK